MSAKRSGAGIESKIQTIDQQNLKDSPSASLSRDTPHLKVLLGDSLLCQLTL
jgi:hypothetical protein